MQFKPVKRREFLTMFGGGVITSPLAARAQQPGVPVVAHLFFGSRETSARNSAAFLKGLNETGLLEGQNVTVEYHWLEGQYDRVSAMATALVARQVSLIAPVSLPIALAVKAATTTIPIVFTIGDDPIKFGLVASLNRPGANITGISFLSPAIEAKRVELLHARELVGKGDRQHVVVEALGGGRDPGLEAMALPGGGPQQHDAGGLDEERAQVPVAAFGDPPENGAISGGDLLRDEPEPSAKVAALGEGVTGSDGGNRGAGDEGADSRHRH
jgi:putative ABC transport system substrate-binding protein